MNFRQYLIEVRRRRYQPPEPEPNDGWTTHEAWHGTPDKRDILQNGFKTHKQKFGHIDDKPTYWAAKEHTVAHTYADDHRAFDYQNAEPATLRVQLRLNNPHTMHWGGMKFHDKDADGNWHHIDHHIEKARDAGHDGVIIHGVRDDYMAKGKSSTIYAVFDNKNIRVKK